MDCMVSETNPTAWIRLLLSSNDIVVYTANVELAA